MASDGPMQTLGTSRFYRILNSNGDVCKPLTPKIISNPYVIIIGVSEYKNTERINLPGVKEDVKKLYTLWNKKFHYYTHIIHLCKNTKSYINDELGNAQAQIHRFKLKDLHFDSVIIHVCGHGINDSLITYDDKRIPIREFVKQFSPHTPVVRCLMGRPKILFIDMCRGTKTPTTYLAEVQEWMGDERKSETVEIKFTEEQEIHPDLDSNIIWSNTKKYAVPAIRKGNHMISELVNILDNIEYDNENNVCKYSLAQIVQMLGDKIDKNVPLKQQCIEHCSRARYDVYFRKNTEKRLTDISNMMKNENPNATATAEKIDGDQKKESIVNGVFCVAGMAVIGYGIYKVWQNKNTILECLKRNVDAVIAKVQYIRR